MTCVEHKQILPQVENRMCTSLDNSLLYTMFVPEWARDCESFRARMHGPLLQFHGDGPSCTEPVRVEEVQVWVVKLLDELLGWLCRFHLTEHVLV